MITLDLALTRPPSCPGLLCISKSCLFFKSYSDTPSWRIKPFSLEVVHEFFCILAQFRSFSPLWLVFINLCAKSQPFFQTSGSQGGTQTKGMNITWDPDLLNRKLWGVGPSNPCFNKPLRGLTQDKVWKNLCQGQEQATFPEHLSCTRCVFIHTHTHTLLCLNVCPSGFIK